MVIVKNIVIVGNEVSFDYFPEGKEVKHKLKTKALIEHIKSEQFKSDVYAKHAYLAVKKAIEQSKEIPKEFTVAWYWQIKMFNIYYKQQRNKTVAKHSIISWQLRR